jgi:hypothetical protein
VKTRWYPISIWKLPDAGSSFHKKDQTTAKRWCLQRNNRTSRHSENLTEAAYVLREQLRTTSAVFLVHTGKSYILMEMPIWKAHKLHYRGGKTIFQVPRYIFFDLIYFSFILSSAFYFDLLCLRHYVCSIIYCLQHFTWFIMSSAVSSAYVFRI